MKSLSRAVLPLMALALGAGAMAEESDAVRHGRAVKGDTSEPMREIIGPATPSLPFGFKVEVPLGRPQLPPTPAAPPSEPQAEGAAQTSPGSRLTPTVDLSVEGLSEVDNTDTVGFEIVPPDTNGDIGFDHLGNRIYIQAINVVWAVFDAETGSRIAGPTAGNSFWTDFGGDCETQNDGDPIVLYDDYAGRWVFSQFVREKGLLCVALSATSDPLGSYHRYAFQLAAVDGTADYPKMGVWPQAPEPEGESALSNQSSYTVTTRNFPFFDDFFMHSTLLERDKMLDGDPAAQFLTLAHSCEIFPTECLEGQLPPHFAGPPPPFGHCPTFVAIRDFPYDDTTVTSDGVRLDKICVKWHDLPNTLFADTFIQAAPPFSRQLGDGYTACISQRPAPGELLDCLSRFTMNRAQFRYFDDSDGNGEHVSVVFNSTVRFVPAPPEPTVAGILWMEMRSPNGIGQWTIHQQGSFSPEDGRERWMGSVAQNGERTIALGYSRTGASEPPSVYYTSRFFNDPAGEMGTEEVCHDGTGVQTASANRWGDYSSMSVDPEDDCTFWYTNEYYETTGAFDFKTRICRFYGCNLAPSVAIDMPSDGGVFDDQTIIDFAGTGTDSEDGDLTSSLAWTSSLDGAIGNGAAFSLQLSAGPHTIETSVTDSGGKTGADEIDITVTSTSCPAHIDVDPGMVLGLDVRKAVNTIDVLSGVSVEGGGDLQLTASELITFENGVSVQSGGALSVVTSADPCG